VQKEEKKPATKKIAEIEPPPGDLFMRDPGLDEEASRSRKDARRSRGRKILGLALVALVGSYLLGFPGCSRRPYTCAVCRLDKVDHGCFGLRWSTREETDCSAWYRQNVERAHAHSWVECTHCRRFGVPGVWGGYGCFVGGPITGLSRIVQIDIYQHFDDRLEAKRLFARLGRMDDEGHRRWDALMEWVDAGYPGTWRDWWEKHRAVVEQ
jgi:hypothetical protein